MKDEFLILLGSVISFAGYVMIWDWWRWHSSAWNFIIPIGLGASAFPFLTAPTRSVFTKAVDQCEILSSSQGSMQAILSMCASVAGFTTPGLVAAYILQTPEQVESSLHHRELTLYALIAPLLMLLLFLGMLLVMIKNNRTQISDAEGASSEKQEPSSERTSLMESQQKAGPRKARVYPANVEAHRRHSVQIMGMSQNSTYWEHDVDDSGKG